jgi:hypothetical protein
MSIEKLINEIKQSTDVHKNQLKLREQILGDLTVPHNGGLFRVTQELMAFLHSWPDTEIYLEDQYGNPVQCQREALLEQCRQQYHKVMNRWHQQHEEIKRIRKI